MNREQNHRNSAQYPATNPDGRTFTFSASGRVQWALEILIAAGVRGCTAIDTPGPRWSDYVFRLRGESLQIETIIERHGGPFAGHHARYVLRSHVVPVLEAAE